MALIELHPELRRTNDLLERIARVGEVACLRLWGVRIGHCAEKVNDPNPRERDETTYASDEAALRHEIISMSKGEQPGNVVDDDDDWTRA